MHSEFEKANYMFKVARKDESKAVRPWVDVVDFICIASSANEAKLWHPSGELLEVDEAGKFVGSTVGWVKSVDELEVVKLSVDPVVDVMTDKGREIRLVPGPFSVNYV